MNILVTGGSKGIGKAIAENLEGNIFTCGRNEELLRGYENYCICDLASIEGIELNEIEHITRVNLEAPMYLISRTIPYMKKQKWGRIINIGSISGVLGEANASLYSATKSGLIGASKALALELAEYGITVNTINPGWVDTEMGNSSAEESEFSKDEIVECIPQRRFVEPSEIAGMVKYLISEDARGVTGQSINLCAGLTCGY